MDRYSVWIHHRELAELRELSNSVNQPIQGDLNADNYDVVEMLVNAYGPNTINWANNEHALSSDQQDPNDSTATFYKMLYQSGVPLYPENNKYTRLSAVTKFLHFKNEYDCSKRGFNDLFARISDFLPNDHTSPVNY